MPIADMRMLRHATLLSRAKSVNVQTKPAREKESRNMKKLKMLAAVAAIATAMLAPLGAWADTWTDDDGHVWTYSTNAVSATISAVTGAEYDMEIPATLGGKPVVAFGTIFKDNTKISDTETIIRRALSGK